ncbi:unnamed protein product [Fraxinus pennsylvanica]|uniref:Kinesin motor domain-containing protein n=1 Tax=Fraxinus pennsylvanica TaxID=56036 RepID=A0AAD1ZJ76_9LAMI|nr:unnamed protein product [Fraxinus pennsylvanica]
MENAASYRADEWNVNKWAWEGTLKVISKGEECIIRLEDKKTGELYARAFLRDGEPHPVEPVIDSSRYFVLRVEENIDGVGINPQQSAAWIKFCFCSIFSGAIGFSFPSYIPFLPGNGDGMVKKVYEDSVSVGDKTYTFDSVLDSKSSQEDVYQLVGTSLVKDALAGYNTSILAYGQYGCPLYGDVFGVLQQDQPNYEEEPVDKTKHWGDLEED